MRKNILSELNKMENHLTKQQLQNYWENKFGNEWIGKCNLCNSVMFPFCVFVHTLNTSGISSPQDVLLICKECSRNKTTQTYYQEKRLNLWLAFFGPVYSEYCYCCKKNMLTFF